MFEGFKSRYIKVKKGKVFCKIKGDGPPLLLLHGYPQTHLMWYKTAPGSCLQYVEASLQSTWTGPPHAFAKSLCFP